MTIDTKVLSGYAGAFKSFDPPMYDKFLRLLDEYVTEVTVAVTEASSSDILQAQGRAQQAIKFLRVFTEIPRTP